MQQITPEFSRTVVADRLGPAETRMEISANEAERKALAERFDLISIDSLTAEVSLRRISSSRLVRVAGRVAADVVQTCVVTLEPVPAHVEEDFELVFAPEEDLDEDDLSSAEIMLDAEAEDPPEPMPNGVIDVGEVAAEHLALGLDPFPRRPGAELPAEYAPQPEDEPAEKPNPFAVLASLKKNDG